MVINLLLCAIFLAVVVYLIRQYVRSDEEEDAQDEKKLYDMNIDYMTDECAKAFSKTLRQSFSEGNMSRREAEQVRLQRTKLSTAVNNAAYGDADGKKYVKAAIKNHISSEEYDIKHNYNKLIPFDRPERITSTDKTNIVLYMFMKEYGDDAFRVLFDEYELAKPMVYDGEEAYVVTKKRMEEVFNSVFSGESSLGDVKLDENDMLEIITQKIYSRYIGFSAIDLLYEMIVDEIDVGVSGVPKNAFEVRTDKRNLPFSYESIWVLVGGVNVRMECMSFESQDDLVRVCENISDYNPPYPLSRENGALITTTNTGGRLVVYRPPFSDSYGFNLRKFDSTPSIKMANLLKDENKIIPIIIVKWIMKGLLTSIISGQQATGKSTFMKSVIAYLPVQYNLRIQEKQFELNLRYTYPYRNIVTFQETPTISAQDGLNIQKKTNGGINIIGEIAEAIQAAFFVQTSNVASYMGMGTHHGVDTDSVINGIANNLLEPTVGLFQDEKNAIKAVANVINIDIHMVNEKGDRHIAYINEVCPTSNTPYPSDSMSDDVSYIDRAACDTTEFYKKTTDPKPYEIHTIVRWEPVLDEDGKKVGGRYVLDQGFGEMMEKKIRERLSLEEEKVFDQEMEMLRRIQNGDNSTEVQEWTQKSLLSA